MMIEYQLCPKCNGQGRVSKAPYVSGDVEVWADTVTSHLCDVCNGAKVISSGQTTKIGDKEGISSDKLNW